MTLKEYLEGQIRHWAHVKTLEPYFDTDTYMSADGRVMAYTDLLSEGIIDPAKVTRVALENAASIATMFLLTECVIYSG